MSPSTRATGDTLVPTNDYHVFVSGVVPRQDNLNFGPSTPVVLELPRGSIFNGSYLAHLINLDQRKNSGEQVPEYGLHKIQILKSVHNGELFYIGKNCHSVAEWRSFFSFM